MNPESISPTPNKFFRKFNTGDKTRSYLFFHERRDIDTGERVLANQNNTTRADLKNALKRGVIDKDRYEELSDNLAQYNEEKIKNLEEDGIDSLTGLSNNPESRIDKLTREMNVYSEDIYAIVVIYIDLNRFKPLNDTHGHKNGDEALRFFARRLKEVTKEGTDLVFRPHSSGDEFIVVLKMTKVFSDEDLKETVERIKKEVNTDFSIQVDKEGTRFSLSASMGYVVQKKGESETAVELLHKADKKMYEDKNADAEKQPK